MKKYLPYLIAVIGLAAVIILMLTAKKEPHRFDSRVTLRHSDKIPYGTYVAYQHLSSLFPDASISVNHAAPGSWQKINSYSQKQALLIISPRFLANRYEMSEIMDFVSRGNDVFISTRLLSSTASEYFRCDVMDADYALPKYTSDFEDSLDVELSLPANSTHHFFYPGYRFDSYFLKYDSLVGEQYGFATYENGNKKFQLPHFMSLKAGQGHIYLHLAPLCFSNYFLLYHDNIQYYNEALSVISPDKKLVVWDDYYLHKFSAGESGSSTKANDENDILSGLMSHPALRAGVWLLVILLLLYVLQEIRRKQRYIVDIPPPRNDSMDFVKTIGRLYYEKSDHKNLSRKMAAYFLEHVRSRYKLPTANLNELFIQTLQMKSGQPEANIREIVSFIHQSETAEVVTPKELTAFHKQLEEFYKTS